MSLEQLQLVYSRKKIENKNKQEERKNRLYSSKEIFTRTLERKRKMEENK